jgi:hypothetical protein
MVGSDPSFGAGDEEFFKTFVLEGFDQCSAFLLVRIV